MKTSATLVLLMASMLRAPGDQRWDFNSGTGKWTSGGMTGLSASGGTFSASSRFTLQVSASENSGDFHIDFPVIPLRFCNLEQWSKATGGWSASTQAGPFQAASSHRISLPISGEWGIFRVRVGFSPAPPPP